MYDFLIVGSGLYGSVFAHQAMQHGKTCLVIDKRNHVGGNLYCKSIEGINVHMYGPHIFHTNDADIWNYVNSFVPFNNYINCPLAYYKGKMYNLPFNMNTFSQVWGTTSPTQAAEKIKSQSIYFSPVTNLEQQAISLVGRELYEMFIKGYTEKQWGRSCDKLPPSIIKRIPVRFTYDNNYFNDAYQGVPIGGYNKLISGMLKDIEVKLCTDYFDNPEHFKSLARKVIYTGTIDKYFNYCFGELEYRSLRFDNQILETDNFQGNAIVNYSELHVPYTRIIEHKHFERTTAPKTVITYEYPLKWNKDIDAYYPIRDEANTKRYNQYKYLAESEKDFHIGGRLGFYRYYDMDQIIASALVSSRKIFSNETLI